MRLFKRKQIDKLEIFKNRQFSLRQKGSHEQKN